MNLPLNVLIIDDSEDDAVLIARTLRRGGYDLFYQRVDTAEAMREALARHAWELVIADYAMPQFSGLAAIEQLRNARMNIPLILVSGAIGEDTVITALKAGADNYVMKDNLARLTPAVERELKESKIRRAQSIVQNQLRKLSRAVEQSPVSVMITDIAGKIDYVNPRFTLMTGYTSDEVLRQFAGALWAQRSKETYHDVWETISTGKEWKGELCDRRKNGESYWISSSISPIYGIDGTITHYIAIEEDITERKQREAEQAARSERLQRQHATLIQLATHRWVIEGHMAEGLDLIADAAAQTLGVDVVHIRHMDFPQQTTCDLLPVELPMGKYHGDATTDASHEEYRRLLQEDHIVIVENARCDARITDPIVAQWGEPDTVAALDAAISVHGKILGVASHLQKSHPRAWQPDEVTFAIQIADLIAQLCLNATLRLRADELATITWIGREITSARDLNQVFSSVAHHAARLAGVKTSGVFAYHGKQMYLAGKCGLSDDLIHEIELLSRACAPPVVSQAVREQRVIQIPDIRQTPEHPLTEAYLREGIYAILAVPILRDDMVIGSIVLWHHEPHQFAPQTITFILALAQQCVHAEENARLFEAEARRRREAETLYAVTQALSATLDLPTVFELILSELQKVVPYDSASVQQLQGDYLVIIGGRGFPNIEELLHVSFDVRDEDNPNSIVMGARAPLVLNNVQDIYQRFKTEPHAQVQTRSWMGIPLIFGDRGIGMISLDKRDPNFYTEDHARLAQAFAAQAAIAIENARLFAEEEQRAGEYARALEQQQRLDQLKDQFIQNVSHELRTPMAIARGYAELLEEGRLGELAPEQREPVQIIARRLRMLSHLTDDINAILEVDTQPPEFGLLDFSRLVETVTKDFRSSALAAGLTITTEIAHDLPQIRGDRVHLRRMVDNLLGNSLKFTPEGGNIDVNLKLDTTCLLLSVSDTGIGIAENQLERIFERFYQVDGSMSRRYGGTGLGLALVKQIAELHGGTVSVESKEGVGSTFTIALPIQNQN